MAIYDVNGNVLSSDTDTTLTKANVPADSKTVGDELRDIHSQIDGGNERRY